MSQVDVILLTKNSEHMLSKCLTSIFENVPVKNLIVIDGFSTDRTLQILGAFSKVHRNIIFLQLGGSRAKARTEGIRHVTTDWFLFVDSDIVLCKGWYKKAQADLASDVAAVWGLNVDIIPNVMDSRVLRLQSILARECFNLRGGTHDTLILTKAVKGIRIPEHLHTYEDAYIMNHIKEQGYRVSVGSEIYCLHYRPPTSWNVKNGFSQAMVEFKCGLVYSHLYEYSLFYPAFLLNWIFQVPLNWLRNNLTPKTDLSQRSIVQKKTTKVDRATVKPYTEEIAAKTNIES